MVAPAPYPKDTKAKGWRLELDMEQFRQSDTWALASPAARPWLLMLWATAWEQVPCGSLPNDDELIAARIGLELDQFTQMKRVLLRNWWIAEDGRLYHDVMVSRVNAMLEKKEKDRARKNGWRARQSESIQESHADVTRDKHGTDAGRTMESTVADDTKHQAPSTSNTSSLRSDVEAPASRKPRSTLKAEDLAAEGVDLQHARDWLKARKVPLTVTAWNGVMKEAGKAGLSASEVVQIMAEKGWRSFEASWNWRGNARAGPVNKQEALEARNRAVLESVLAEDGYASVGQAEILDIDC